MSKFDGNPLTIEVEGVSRKYDDFLAVNNVRFSVPKGQIVGLLGHNGAGKTTTIKMITGFLEPTEGVVKIHGQQVDKDPIQVQKRIGYLPEHSPLYPEMSVVEYLEFVARVRELPEGQIRSAVMECMKETGLIEKMHAPIICPVRG